MSWAVLSTADALEDFLTYQNNNISINSNYFEECFFFFLRRWNNLASSSVNIETVGCLT